MPSASSTPTTDRKEREARAANAKVRIQDAPQPEYDEQKFKELVLYLAEKSADDPSFGDTKLNKLLFFSDFLAYAVYGRPITGAVYQKLEHGPAPRRLLPARRELVEARDATVVKRGRAYARTVTVNRRPADTRLFDPDELDLVDEIVELLRTHDATDVSDFSHQFSAGWKLGKPGDDIPYDSIFLSVGTTLTPYEVERGRELAHQFDLLA